MIESSGTYSTRLTPDRRLRRRVRHTACLLAVLGNILLFDLPLEPLPLAAAVVAWSTLVAWQTARLDRGWRRTRHLQLDACGRGRVIGPDGNVLEVRLAYGTVVLGRLAWLCLAGDDGRKYCELLCGDSRCSDSWRRLQVIWRYIGAPS